MTAHEMRIYVGEFDVAAPPDVLRTPHLGSAAPYRRARLLARRGSSVLGILDVELHDGVATGRQLTAEIERLLSERLDEPDEEDASGPLPHFSVVVCTRDRPDSLRRTLESILAIDERFELLVVDNAPHQPGTRACIEGLGDDRLRYIAEPVAGLSRARNRGVAETNGELIAFTDDDVAVDAHWLRALARGFAGAPEVACVTGLVLAAALETFAQQFFEAKVKWSDNMRPRIFDLRARRGDSPLFPYAPGAFGAGANFAVRRAALATIGPFDEALGAGTPSRGGEDLDFFARVALAGFALAYEPSALVWHFHRAERDSLRKQMYGYGSGLTAYAFKHLLAGGVLRQIVGGRRHRATRPPLRPVTPARRVPQPAGPRSLALRLTEIRGMLAGPLLYMQGRRMLRRRSAADRAR